MTKGTMKHFCWVEPYGYITYIDSVMRDPQFDALRQHRPEDKRIDDYVLLSRSVRNIGMMSKTSFNFRLLRFGAMLGTRFFRDTT